MPPPGLAEKCKRTLDDPCLGRRLADGRSDHCLTGQEDGVTNSANDRSSSMWKWEWMDDQTMWSECHQHSAVSCSVLIAGLWHEASGAMGHGKLYQWNKVARTTCKLAPNHWLKPHSAYGHNSATPMNAWIPRTFGTNAYAGPCSSIFQTKQTQDGDSIKHHHIHDQTDKHKMVTVSTTNTYIR
ncbi:Os05g0161901 [Oryza sativa Japonica Group]|uniref:Os05g0161901 protein n=1 Tax=Oryza sativa subsp. japonica TaxID=39947 RepID=C7J2V6_ORYSJ|nr:Os05g0161901 [Oryza sativa Japonica Group]|eukprot:NP_001174230.1 Os05g0161901 [Oryza sativa Japonica Group]